MDAGPMASVTRTSCEDQVWGLKYACLPAMMWNHIGCFCFDFSPLCVYKCYFKLLAWEDIYIYSQSLHFVWIFSAVYFQSSNDLRINYHIGCICQTFLTLENFCTTSALSPEMRPLPSVSFHVHLQVVSTRKRFSSMNWPCGPSNSSNILKLNLQTFPTFYN